MALHKIITYGHPTLRKKAARITKFDENLKKLAEDMIETMQVSDGIGLAAPQINKSIQIIVIGMDLIDEKWKPRAFVNPKIVAYSDETDIMEEGCLSIPGIREDVVRPIGIKVRFQNLDGSEEEWEVNGLLARVFQHEIDHLNGILFTDRVSPLKKKLLEPKLEQLRSLISTH